MKRTNFQVVGKTCVCVCFFLNFIFEMKNSSNHYMLLVLSINPVTMLRWKRNVVKYFSLVLRIYKAQLILRKLFIFLSSRQQWMFIGFPFRIINYSITTHSMLLWKWSFSRSHFMLNVDDEAEVCILRKKGSRVESRVRQEGKEKGMKLIWNKITFSHH